MRINYLKSTKKRWIKMGLVLMGLMAILYWRVQLLDVLSLIADRNAIVEFLEQYGILGPVALFMILGLQVFLTFIPGHAFIVAGGYIYGLLLGATITQISTVLASQLAFLLVRRYGRPLVDRMAPPKVIDHWNKLAQKQGILFYFFSFVLPIFPNDLMSFIAGLGSISPRKFFIANFLGRLPCAIIITLIGSHGFELPLYFWVLVIILLLSFCLIWKHIAARIAPRGLDKFSSSGCLC